MKISKILAGVFIFVVISITIGISVIFLTAEKWSGDLAFPAPVDTSLPDVGWPHYGNDAGGSRYSTADQITRNNLSRLKPVWVFNTDETGEGYEVFHKHTFQATPILIGDSLYFSTTLGRIHSVDARNGELRWIHDVGLDPSVHYSEAANRGVAYWKSDQVRSTQTCHARIFAGTLDARLVALDARKGWLCKDFGDEGEVDLRMTLSPRNRGRLYPVTSPPVVAGNTVILGSGMIDGWNSGKGLGTVWAIDASNGTLRWKWHAIPRDGKGDNANDWYPDQLKKTGTANAWAPLSVDAERGLVFVPTGSASPDYYGGLRLGNNRYANSLVALDVQTGEVVWARQLVHHDLWDYDLASQPTLAEIERDGEKVPVVIQATKMGMLFTFHRETGEPFHEVREHPVPGSDVPGEEAWPSQPFPVAPPPLVSHEPLTPEDAWGPTPGMRGRCEDWISSLKSDGIYTPPSIQGSVTQPGIGGGSNWGGVSWHPGRQVAIANVNRLPFAVALIPRESYESVRTSGQFDGWEFAPQPTAPYGMRRTALVSPEGLPCVKPPWGTLAAVDMKAGEILWEVPLGTVRDVAPLPLSFPLGMPNTGGSLVLENGLIFIGAAMDNYLRAFDLDTGEMLWRHRLPAGGQATPMTYQVEGRQFIVIAAGGHGSFGTKRGDALVAFALSEE